MESFKRAKATPIAQVTIITEEGNTVNHTRYVGKMESSEGNYIYWVGSSLGRETNDLCFETFSKAMAYVRGHVKPDVKIFDVAEF